MKTIAASGQILMRYETGDRPVLVLCADGHHYICKYKLPGVPANKLLNELIGHVYAKSWGINTPVSSFISNDPIIWGNHEIRHDSFAPLFGSRRMSNVIDLNEITCTSIPVSALALRQLLTIALFDLWITNEDRICNNYNLLYDIKQENIVSIDYGGIFNSAIINRPSYQLSESDSILTSNLYERLKKANVNSAKSALKRDYYGYVNKCKKSLPEILGNIPPEWNIDVTAIKEKIDSLFNSEWIEDTWDNFNDISNSI